MANISRKLRMGHDLYFFMMLHPELKLEIEDGKILSVTFPDNCSTSTFILEDGKILFIQYATFDSPELLFTYDALEDLHYYENLEKLIKELTS